MSKLRGLYYSDTHPMESPDIAREGSPRREILDLGLRALVARWKLVHMRHCRRYIAHD
jgi:hypothetical protein